MCVAECMSDLPTILYSTTFRSNYTWAFYTTISAQLPGKEQRDSNQYSDNLTITLVPSFHSVADAFQIWDQNPDKIHREI